MAFVSPGPCLACVGVECGEAHLAIHYTVAYATLRLGQVSVACLDIEENNLVDDICSAVFYTART